MIELNCLLFPTLTLNRNAPTGALAYLIPLYEKMVLPSLDTSIEPIIFPNGVFTVILFPSVFENEIIVAVINKRIFTKDMLLKDKFEYQSVTIRYFGIVGRYDVT